MMKTQKQKASSNSGLQRYQIQQHRGLIRSLELEYRYNQKQLEQQRRHFLKSRTKLSLAIFHSSSQGTESKSSHTSTVPFLKGTPSLNEGISNQEASLEKMDGVKRELEPLKEGLCGEETLDKLYKLADEDKPSWNTLSFSDVKQRYAARMQALQAYVNWQHQILSPQGFPGTGSTRVESKRHDFYSPKFKQQDAQAVCIHQEKMI